MTPESLPRWGIVSTIKASRIDVLRFCAYHLQAGAHRLYIYLDDPKDPSFEILKAHPKIRPQRCGPKYWDQRGGRPKKHQVRQVKNATHAYQRKADVDWLAHIDVDEFLYCDQSVAEHLSGLSPDTKCARVHPCEALAGDDTAFKAITPRDPNRDAITQHLYPEFGDLLRIGFLSHVAGKVFARTGLNDIRFRIHNVYQGDEMNPNQEDLPALSLAHFHAQSWDAFIRAYRYRLEKGSYRSDLPPHRSRENGGVTLHEVLTQIEAEAGEDGLRRFYTEVCTARPELLARLKQYGLLKRMNLQQDRAVSLEFPGEI